MKLSNVTYAGALFVASMLAILFIGQVGGCDAIQDLTAKAIGAPTMAEKNEVLDKLDSAEAAVAEADKEIDAMAAEMAKAAVVKDAAIERADFIRRTYSEAAAKLANLSGPAAESMMEVLEELKAEMTASKSEADRAAGIVAGFEAKIAGFVSQREQAADDIQSIELQMKGMDEKTARAIASATGLVKFAGDTASTLGIVGAKPIADSAGLILGTALTSILGGTTLASLRTARRERKKGEAAQEDADDLAKVITTTEKLGLIRDDAEAKAIARSELGERALVKLRTIKAKVPIVHVSPEPSVNGKA